MIPTEYQNEQAIDGVPDFYDSTMFGFKKIYSLKTGDSDFISESELDSLIRFSDRQFPFEYYRLHFHPVFKTTQFFKTEAEASFYLRKNYFENFAAQLEIVSIPVTKLLFRQSNMFNFIYHKLLEMQHTEFNLETLIKETLEGVAKNVYGTYIDTVEDIKVDVIDSYKTNSYYCRNGNFTRLLKTVTVTLLGRSEHMLPIQIPSWGTYQISMDEMQSLGATHKMQFEINIS